MTDYGRVPSFGIFPSPEAASLATALDAVRVADESGLDLIGVQDHPYQRRFLDTMTLLAHIAATTDRVTVFPDVANLPLRPPAVLAKSAASIDVLSDGRFELGLGAGAFWEAIEAFGGRRLSPGESLRALREAITIIRLIWSSERSARFEGEFYRVAGAKPGPQPAHDIGIWLGVYGPRALRLLGEVADGWVPSIPRMPVEELAQRNAIIDEAAIAAGRDPADIRRVANVNGVITDGASKGPFEGPTDQWVNELAGLVLEHGLDSFVLWPDGDLVEQTHRFSEVAERTRTAVAKERS